MVLPSSGCPSQNGCEKSRRGIVRLQFQGPAVTGDRFVQFPLELQRIGQVVMRPGIVRLQLQRPAVAGNRFGNPAQGKIRSAQIAVELGLIPLQTDRPSDILDGNLVLANLVGNHTEKMPRIGMLRLGLQDPPIDLLGGLQPAGLVVLNRDRQCFGNRCHDFCL
jgi:hypothetical protein